MLKLKPYNKVVSFSTITSQPNEEQQLFVTELLNDIVTVFCLKQSSDNDAYLISSINPTVIQNYCKVFGIEESKLSSTSNFWETFRLKFIGDTPFINDFLYLNEEQKKATYDLIYEACSTLPEVKTELNKNSFTTPSFEYELVYVAQDETARIKEKSALLEFKANLFNTSLEEKKDIVNYFYPTINVDTLSAEAVNVYLDDLITMQFNNVASLIKDPKKKVKLFIKRALTKGVFEQNVNREYIYEDKNLGKIEDVAKFLESKVKEENVIAQEIIKKVQGSV